MNYKKGTQTRNCMKSVMRYVSQMSKTLWDGQQLVSGIGCQPETAFDEFLSTKLLHHKDGGVMFYHMVQSFPKGADIDPRTAHEAARQLAGYFEGCEVLVCTHVDREHIHSHCIRAKEIHTIHAMLCRNRRNDRTKIIYGINLFLHSPASSLMNSLDSVPSHLKYTSNIQCLQVMIFP